jgi:hypothetical protein
VENGAGSKSGPAQKGNLMFIKRTLERSGKDLVVLRYYPSVLGIRLIPNH